MRTPPSWPQINLIVSQRLYLQTPSHLRVRDSMSEFQGDTNLQSASGPKGFPHISRWWQLECLKTVEGGTCDSGRFWELQIPEPGTDLWDPGMDTFCGRLWSFWGPRTPPLSIFHDGFLCVIASSHWSFLITQPKVAFSVTGSLGCAFNRLYIYCYTVCLSQLGYKRQGSFAL